MDRKISSSFIFVQIPWGRLIYIRSCTNAAFTRTSHLLSNISMMFWCIQMTRTLDTQSCQFDSNFLELDMRIASELYQFWWTAYRKNFDTINTVEKWKNQKETFILRNMSLDWEEHIQLPCVMVGYIDFSWIQCAIELV